MSCIGLPPREAIASENVRDLQLWAGQRPGASRQASPRRLILQIGQHLVGADGVLDRLGGNVGVLCRGRQLGMAQQNRMTRTSVFASSRCVAKLCRNVCSVAGFEMPAMCFADVKALFN